MYCNTMEKKSKILLAVIVIGIILSVGYTFYKTIIKADFEVVLDATAKE